MDLSTCHCLARQRTQLTLVSEPPPEIYMTHLENLQHDKTKMIGKITGSYSPLVNTNVSQGLSRAERKISEATEVPQFYSFNV